MRGVGHTTAILMSLLFWPIVGISAECMNPAVTSRTVINSEAYYGDLHLFTTYSFSAYLSGVRAGPDEAYQFARGDSVLVDGVTVRRTSAPLDFLAVTDQAENLGLFNTLDDPSSDFSKSEMGRAIKRHDPNAVRQIMERMLTARTDPFLGVNEKSARAIMDATWRREIEAANRNYQPGKFTTFIAYHWTSHLDGINLHRNVIFSGDDAPPPFSSIDSVDPEDLWSYLDRSRQLGYEAIAIPHNSNLSKGTMFALVDGRGRAIDRAYAERRATHEPLAEIANLGASETHPALSPNDPFSQFELFGLEKMEKPSGSYVRDALGRGIELAQGNGGTNPYKLGFVGSTDYSNALSDAAENAFVGGRGAIDPSKPLIMENAAAGMPESTAIRIRGAGSMTGVWAVANTRQAIFGALRRRETFATSGTRIKIRFFGGWDYSGAVFRYRKNWIGRADCLGVPMGGDLPPKPAKKRAPSFLIWAAKDPNGANLDRAQIIKLSIENNHYVENIYDVALSNGRKTDPRTGEVHAVGNTVDLQTAGYDNSIGVAELSALWQDPTFDSATPAIYYVRVLEIPTPRWSTIAARKRNLSIPTGVPATIQERGWSSPIWYTPSPE